MRILKILVLIVIVILAVLQLAPQGRDKTNPPVTLEPEWDAQTTADFARRACYDCHSNQTRWPWYSHVAPASWRVVEHVEHGRSELNFSEFDRPQSEAAEAAEMVETGEMPPWDYLLLHPEARLNEEERAAFVRGLKATFGTEEHEH